MTKSKHLYKVTIPYREPVYELHRGSPLKQPYLATYEVEAEDKKEAVDKALSSFRSEALASGVAWHREPDYENIVVDCLLEEAEVANGDTVVSPVKTLSGWEKLFSWIKGKFLSL